MPRIKKRPMRPGDLIVNVGEKLSCSLSEEREFYKKNLHDEPSCWDYIERLSLHTLEKLEKNTYWVNHPLFPIILSEGERNWGNLDHFTHREGKQLEFSRETYNKLLKIYPSEFKLNDKILNPLLKYSDEDINDYDVDSYFYDISVYSNNYRDAVKRCEMAKSFPFLYIKNIDPIVLFNIKYEKFLFFLEYRYHCAIDSADDDIHVSITTTNKKQIQLYSSFNSIWNTICTSPNQVT